MKLLLVEKNKIVRPLSKSQTRCYNFLTGLDMASKLRLDSDFFVLPKDEPNTVRRPKQSLQ